MEGENAQKALTPNALLQVIKALEPLDDETRRRVIESACVFIGVKATFQPAPPLR